MIGKFLRTRRRQLVRADFGLPPIARGSSGLRREEVAYLARVSITWYTRLEQGRAITPSRQVLDALAGYPAYALAPDWAVTAWNTAYAALYPNVATVAAADRNLLWLLFTDPYLRTLMPDWEFTSLYNAASFRAQAGPRLGDSPFCHLVQRLLQTSEAYRAAWQNYES